MKFKLIIDKEKEEQILVYAHKKSKLTDEIQHLVEENTVELNGYKDREVVRLNISDIYSFLVEKNKIYALTEKDVFLLKCRLYQLEELFSDGFIKINQSCMVNVKMIAKFDASLSGALKVILKNGYSDYVSRRNIKTVKERLGL